MARVGYPAGVGLDGVMPRLRVILVQLAQRMAGITAGE